MIISSKDSATSFWNRNLHIFSRSKDITGYSAEIFGSKRNTNLDFNWIHFSSLHGFSDRYEKSFGGIEDRYIESPKSPFWILRSVRIHCNMCFKIKNWGVNVTFESKSFNQCKLELYAKWTGRDWGLEWKGFYCH